MLKKVLASTLVVMSLVGCGTAPGATGINDKQSADASSLASRGVNPEQSNLIGSYLKKEMEKYYSEKRTILTTGLSHFLFLKGGPDVDGKWALAYQVETWQKHAISFDFWMAYLPRIQERLTTKIDNQLLLRMMAYDKDENNAISKSEYNELWKAVANNKEAFAVDLSPEDFEEFDKDGNKSLSKLEFYDLYLNGASKGRALLTFFHYLGV